MAKREKEKAENWLDMQTGVGHEGGERGSHIARSETRQRRRAASVLIAAHACSIVSMFACTGLEVE